MSKTTIEILREARALLAGPKSWTQGVFARDDEGTLCLPLSPRATCWCAIGAIRRAAGEDFATLPGVSDVELIQAKITLAIAVSQFRGRPRAVVVANVADWNDDPARTHAEVLELFDKAIAIEATKLLWDPEEKEQK